MPLLSMTGFGNASDERAGHALSVEVRTINGRHLKLNIRTTDSFSSLEARIETVVREYLRRGTVNVNIRIRHIGEADDFRVNVAVLEGYLDQLQKLAARRRMTEELRLEPLMTLPGVIEELSEDARDAETLWPHLEPVLRTALDSLTAMRSAEGAALAADLTAQCKAVESGVARVAARTPAVAENYRQKLHDRIREALAQFGVTVDPGDLVRELCLFTDRSDISEEIVRLRSHLVQFSQTMAGEEGPGRKLEFICQEMGREANTIGSKANDAEISLAVVDVKTALERIREQIQNVE